MINFCHALVVVHARSRSQGHTKYVMRAVGRMTLCSLEILVMQVVPIPKVWKTPVHTGTSAQNDERIHAS